MGEGFKAHDGRLGPKLGASVAAGPTGLQRRVEAARARERARELARRGQAGESALGGCNLPERSGGEQGTGVLSAAVKGGVGLSPEKKRGRPRIEGLRPWEFEGVSRRTWERRRAKARGG
jgi:hypothetical protein